jgi:hypothetical protein
MVDAPRAVEDSFAKTQTNPYISQKCNQLTMRLLNLYSQRCPQLRPRTYENDRALLGKKRLVGPAL